MPGGVPFVDLARQNAAIADGLKAAIGLRPEDVLINLVEVKKENWSFGNGIAQYTM